MRLNSLSVRPAHTSKIQNLQVAAPFDPPAVRVLRMHERIVMGTCKLFSRQRVATTSCAVLLTPGISGRWTTSRPIRSAMASNPACRATRRLLVYSVADCVYSDSSGDETTVVMMHRGNGEHDEMNRRALACFDVALADVGLPNNNVLRQVLHDYFARGDHDNAVPLPPFRR